MTAEEPARGYAPMGSMMTDDSSEIDDFARRAVAGDEQAPNAVFQRHRERLERMVRFGWTADCRDGSIRPT